jgi:threonine aldolase
MLQAMFKAAVGDDVFGDDPSVKLLEEKTAQIFGKEAGIFCPSGTMANQIAVKLHTRPGDEVICDRTAHVYNYEGGGLAFNSGCSVKLIYGDRGRFTAEQVEECINPDDIHQAITRMVVIENTSNKGGGSCWEMEDIKAISKLCRKRGLACHLDGARIFNALISKGQDALEMGKLFDTISICLSKGLGAPVGSLLLGSREHIKQARRIRKVLGGGMRQVGYLAAAGSYALDHHIERLREDHSRARSLAEILRNLSFVESVITPETNILIFSLISRITPKAFLEILTSNNILATPFGGQTIRFVTHLDFDDRMLERVIDSLIAIDRELVLTS